MRRRPADQAMVSVVATSYLLGVSTPRVDKLVEQLGITRLPRSEVSEMAKDLDGQVRGQGRPRVGGGLRPGRRRLAVPAARPGRPRPAASNWLPPTLTPDWSRGSVRDCPARPGSAAAPNVMSLTEDLLALGASPTALRL
jgi:hypothetical protein